MPRHEEADLEGDELNSLLAASAPKINLDPEKVEQGLGKIVLTLIELLRKLLEKQALRRVENDSLSPEEVERLGIALMRLENKMDELKGHFGIEDEELNIDLGPLGRLI